MDGLYKLTPKQIEDEIVEKNPEVPIIYGDFTNWEPKPFFEICDISEKFLPQYDDDYVFNLMKAAGKMGYGQSNDMESLTKKQLGEFQEFVVKFYNEKIPVSWKEVFEHSLPYKKPNLVFGANTRPDYYKKLFVFASMLKVGKHEFIVRSPGLENPNYYFFSNVCDIRAEQIHHFVKTSKHTEHLKILDKENSVF